MSEQEKQSERNLKNRVLARIEDECVTPTSKWVFLCKYNLTRILWVISIGVGALAVSVSLFSVLRARYAFYEATHSNLYTFVVEVLPYLWLTVLFIMLLAAIYNFRHLKRGYRYSLTVVMLSSAGLSFAGGVGLHLLGIGQMVDEKLGVAMPFYQSLERYEIFLWQRPNEGRLVGVVQKHGSDEAEILFQDVSGKLWTTRVVDLREADLKLLRSNEQVRMLGFVLSTSTPHFHACGVFPWLFDDAASMRELAHERTAFLNRMNAYNEQLTSPATTSLKSVAARTQRCADLTVVKKIREVVE